MYLHRILGKNYPWIEGSRTRGNPRGNYAHVNAVGIIELKNIRLPVFSVFTGKVLRQLAHRADIVATTLSHSGSG